MDIRTPSTPETLTAAQRREQLRGQFREQMRGQIREINFEIEDLESKISQLSEQREALRRGLAAIE